MTNPQDPIRNAISEIQQETKPSFRQKFFDTLKTQYPNLHSLYVTSCIIGIWSGAILISDSWARGDNLMAAPADPFNFYIIMRHFGLLMLGLLMLLLDDLSLKELMFMRKTESEKPIEKMNMREKFFHTLKDKYPNLATIYTLLAIIFSWCGIWGLYWDIPAQPFWRSIATVLGGFFLLYIDDMKLDEL